MKDRELDEILKRAAQAPHDVDPAVLDRVANSIGSSLRPVRPLPPRWVLASGLILICVAVALAGAARAGFYGIEELSVLERALIFPVMGILICLAATACVSEMIPGTRRIVSPGILLGVGTLTLLAVFAFLFRDYRTEHFVSAGVVCLMTGLLHAVPTGLVSWWFLRRGFAVTSVAAGLVGGTLAGLAGVTMLELHCANFQALHILLWHTAVVPVSGAAGALLAWVLRFRADSAASERSTPK
ncbi:MAG: NrsF family protein [Candidatus Sulfotelmatobacter sp.]